MQDNIKTPEQFFDQSSKHFMAELLRPINNVYVELDALWDYKIGALTGMIDTEAEYQYILHRIQQYNTGNDKRISKMFPVLDISDDDVLEFLKDPEHSNYLCSRSPITSLYTEFPLWLEEIFRHNRRESPNSDVNLYLNCRYFRYPKPYQQQLVKLIQDAFPYTTVTFLHGNVAFAGEEFIKKMQFFILSDLQEFLPEGSTTGKLMEANKMFDVYVKCIRSISPTVLDRPDCPAQDSLIESTAAFFNMMCNFEYVNANVITESKHNG